MDHPVIGLKYVATILNAINYNVQIVYLVISNVLVKREHLRQASDQIPPVMKWFELCGCILQIVIYSTGTQTTSISRLINLSLLRHLRTDLSDLKQGKLYNERTNQISNRLFGNHWKSKFKIPEVEKSKKCVAKAKKL